MADYTWACLACEQSNPPGAMACTRCNCPATPNSTDVTAHTAHFTATQGRRFECAKCSHDKFEVGETRNSGGLLASVFEVETEKFSFIACARCGFTEFYRCERSALRSLFDLGMG